MKGPIQYLYEENLSNIYIFLTLRVAKTKNRPTSTNFDDQ